MSTRHSKDQLNPYVQLISGSNEGQGESYNQVAGHLGPENAAFFLRERLSER